MLEDEFGDLIAKARGGLGVSADELSRQTGILHADIAAFEGYRKSPTREQSDALAGVLELDVAKLWAIAAEVWEPAAVTGMISGSHPVDSVWYERYRVWTYVVGDLESKQCLPIFRIVDPSIPVGMRTTRWPRSNAAVGRSVRCSQHTHMATMSEFWSPW